jgi:hypothetical protein
MCEQKSKKSTDALTSWKSLSKRQKDHIFLMGPMLAAGVALIVVLLGIIGWSLIDVTVSYILGNPSDGFLLNVYYGYIDSEGLLLLAMFGTPIITLIGLAYLALLARIP